MHFNLVTIVLFSVVATMGLANPSQSSEEVLANPSQSSEEVLKCASSGESCARTKCCYSPCVNQPRYGWVSTIHSDLVSTEG